jgi:hypothetical protein
MTKEAFGLLHRFHRFFGGEDVARNAKGDRKALPKIFEKLE